MLACRTCGGPRHSGGTSACPFEAMPKRGHFRDDELDALSFAPVVLGFKWATWARLETLRKWSKTPQWTDANLHVLARIFERDAIDQISDNDVLDACRWLGVSKVSDMADARARLKRRVQGRKTIQTVLGDLDGDFPLHCDAEGPTDFLHVVDIKIDQASSRLNTTCGWTGGGTGQPCVGVLRLRE
jgi:hypothetical protein